MKSTFETLIDHLTPRHKIALEWFQKNKNNPGEDERLTKVEDKLNSFDSSVNEKLININKQL